MGFQDLLDRARLTSDDESPDDDGADDAPVVPDDASDLIPDDLLPQDPKPGKRKRARMKPPAIPGAKVTAAQKRQVEDSLILLQSLIGGGLSFRDPVCGGAITSNAEQVAKAAVPIICRNPALLAWFTGGAGFMDVLGLLVALQPVAGTIWSHHVTHSIGHPDAQGGGETVDYSAYQAPPL